MRKTYAMLIAIILTSVVFLTGCFEAGNKKSNIQNNVVEPEPVGFWNNTTSYRWVSNGTCCGEKEQLLQIYLLDGISTNETRWIDTNRTRNNLSKLPDDGWYPSGLGDLYSREEYYRQYFPLGGACLYSIKGVRWKPTGIIIMYNINSSKDISVERDKTEDEWFFVVEPVGNRTVDIAFVVSPIGFSNISKDDLPVFRTSDMRTEYHSGKTILPDNYLLSIHISSGSVNIYILDEYSYENVFG